MNLAAPLVVLSLLLLAARVWQPWAPAMPGKPLAIWRVPLRARVAIQRSQVYAVAAIVVLGGLGGWLPGVIQLVVVAVALAIVFWPWLSYTLTDEGFALGRTPPRRWSEFSRCTAESGRIALDDAASGRTVSIWLSDTPGTGKVAGQVCQLVDASASPVQRGAVLRHGAKPARSSGPA
jgi:hypothetical protein